MMKHILTIIISTFLAVCGSGGATSGGAQLQQLRTETILAYGDSTMCGLGGSTTPTAIINQDLLAAGLSEVVENLAVSGTQLHELLVGRDGRNPRLEQSLQVRPAARYVLENFGINEAMRLLDLFIPAVRSAGKSQVIITPNPIFVSNEAVMALFSQNVQAAHNVAKEEGVSIIDVTAQFPDATRADLIDELHPNSRFYKRVADFEAAELIKMIRQRN